MSRYHTKMFIYDIKHYMIRGSMPKGWKTIIIPEVIYKVLKEYANSQGRALWEVVASALATYIAFEKELDKKLWYVFKLLNSYAELKTSLRLSQRDLLDGETAREYVKSCLERFKKTCWQIQERLRIKTEHLVGMIEEDLERINYVYHGKTVMKWNDEMKIIVRNLLVSKI